MERVEIFLEEFRALRASSRVRRLARMGDFLQAFDEATQGLGRAAGRDFSVFSLLGIRADEVKHTRMLAWLLDARGEHGAGNVFLRALVELCGFDIPVRSLERYNVRREFWVAESVVDLTVYRRGEFVIYLENKVFAVEGPAQLEREFRDMHRWGAVLRVPEDRRFGIFLTPGGRKPRSGDELRWRALSYREVAQRFRGLISEVVSEKGQLLVRDWIETVAELGGR